MNRKCVSIFALLFLLAPGAWAQQHIISTVAGGGPSTVPLSAAINSPDAVFKDASGNLYIAATNANSIYKIDTTGNLSAVAGNGITGSSGDGGPATAALLNAPTDVFVDTHGNVFIADTSNNRIREIVAATGSIKTVAGNGVAGYNGDGISATAAELNTPTGVAVDLSGNIFIAEINGCRVREVVASTSNIQTVAGTPGAGTPGTNPTGNCGFNGNGIAASTAQLNGPSAISFDSLGNLYVADQGNYCVREIALNGQIADVAGTCTVPGAGGDGGAATSAHLQRPVRLFVTGGNIYISDIADNRVREVVAATGLIETVAGTGTAGFAGDGGLAVDAELNEPSGVWVDSPGNIFLTDVLNNRVREVTAANGLIQTVAGNGTSNGDAGPATTALFNEPTGVAVDSSSNVFVTDLANNRVREVISATGIVGTFAGNGTFGFSGDGGPATGAELAYPTGVFVGTSGNVFIADYDNNRIREVVTATGNIQTVAGNGTQGYSGDGGPATSAELNHPTGVFVDGSGNIFIADYGNQRIREVMTATGIIQTVAGNGTSGYSGDGGPATSAELNGPIKISMDSHGNIFISDFNNNRVREVLASTGNIQTVAGNGTAGFSGDGGPATNAELNFPRGVVVDRTGNIFITDTSNNRIREVSAASGNIATVAGNGIAGFSGDGGPAASAELNAPESPFGDGQGNLFFSDASNNRVRKIAGVVASAPSSIVASGGTPQSTTVSTSFATPLSATVTDAFGNSVAGVVVTFTVPAAGASGTFSDGVNTALTNAAGVATSTAFTANTVAGGYTVTAAVTGAAAPANFLLNNLPGSPNSITTTSGTPQSAPISTAFGTALAATVHDAYGNAVPGANVTFIAPAKGASGTFVGGSSTATVATNTQGLGTAPAFTANSTIGGPYNVTAAVAGVATLANFSLTNNPAPLQITTTVLGASQISVPYSQTLTAAGGVPPYTWSVSSGALPAGLALNPSTGVISGTALTAGSSAFTPKVTDSENPPVSQTLPQPLSIAVVATIVGLQIVPQPSVVAISATAVHFFAQDQNGNLVPATWGVSNGGGSISPTGIYSAPPGASPGTTVTLTATAIGTTVQALPITFQLQTNGLELCCVTKVQPYLNVPPGAPQSNPTGVQLDGVPVTSTDPFTVTCNTLDSQGNVQPMPVGSGCIFTLPPSKGGTAVQSISGSANSAFCYVFVTRTTTIGANPPRPFAPWNRAPWQRLISLTAGLFALIAALLSIRIRKGSHATRLRAVLASGALICASVTMLGACNGFSSQTVPQPPAQATPAGQYTVRVLVSPPAGSSFVQSQLIFPLNVNP